MPICTFRNMSYKMAKGLICKFWGRTLVFLAALAMFWCLTDPLDVDLQKPHRQGHHSFADTRTWSQVHKDPDCLLGEVKAMAPRLRSTLRGSGGPLLKAILPRSDSLLRAHLESPIRIWLPRVRVGWRGRLAVTRVSITRQKVLMGVSESLSVQPGTFSWIPRHMLKPSRTNPRFPFGYNVLCSLCQRAPNQTHCSLTQ